MLKEGSSLGEAVNPVLEKCHRDNSTGSILLAVNREYSKEDRILNDGDEIAVMPLVSGG
ncbi:MAG: MoaD/ThiS family protein [Candidatus Thermoplasmatota archaeon]|nr:MoaD/ThiS family protein [Candidatus Thermoplasmatota archaeon]MCL5785723.1 MoaD/ThiS family protein [Candidatus Thermoplasmatota archaeon]